MAKVSSFNFTNTTANANVTSIKPVKLGLTTNYALTEDEPASCVENNKTCPLDQPEITSFRCRDIPKVNSVIPNQYPAPVSDGVQYIITVDELLSTRDDAIGYRVDDPIVASLTIRHTKSGNITAEHIQTVINRLLGACYKEDGTSRFDDLMRSALKPVAN